MFRIQEHVDFDAKGRAQCPRCLLEGKTNKNLSLIPGGDGAYKCHRGCTTAEIREAIGQPKDKIVPTALAVPEKPAPKVTVPPSKVREATEKLITDTGIRRQWLHDRGITDEMILHYKVGWVRAKIERWHFDAISIPLPVNEGTSYYQKKRVSPWLPEPPKEVKEWKKWSQYGIPAQVYITHQPEQPQQTWLCEGEWDAIRLGWIVRHSDRRNDIQVSTFSCGSGNVPHQAELDRLRGEVIIFYDLDEAGATGQEKVCKALGNRARVAIVPYPPEFEQGWDVSNAIDYGFTLEDFIKAASEATVPKGEPKQNLNNPLRQRLIHNDDLLDNAPEFTDWLVPDLFTSDELFLMAGPPRQGKSLLAMTLALSVASGGKFMGRPCTQGAVIYIRCEDSDTKTKEREIAQGWSRGLPVYWLEEFKLSELPHLEELIEELGVRLVVFDTLSRIRDASISESSAEMSQVLEPVQQMCKRLGCTGILVHHTGKISAQLAGEIDVFDTIRGSSAIRATCRGTVVLAAAESNYRLCVENGWGKLDLQVLLDANTLQWRLLGNWVGADVDLSQKDRVLNYLSTTGRATIDQIAEATNLPKRSLYEVLKRLQSEEMIQKQGSRQNAVYIRSSIQQIQQFNTLLNRSNPDAEKNISSIQQNSERGSTDEKVIILDKSDHFLPPNADKNDHFSNPVLSVNLLNNGSNPGIDRVNEFNSNSTRIQHELESDHFGTLTGTSPPFLTKGMAIEVRVSQKVWKPGIFLKPSHIQTLYSMFTKKKEVAYWVRLDGADHEVEVTIDRIRTGGSHDANG